MVMKEFCDLTLAKQSNRQFDFNKKIIFLFKAGRRARMDRHEEFPTEFFYGFQELFESGLNVAFVEDDDIGMAAPRNAFSRFAVKLSVFFGGLPIGMALGLLAGKQSHELNKGVCLVATTNGIGMALALAKAFGQLKCPVVLLAMGLLPRKFGWWRRFLYSRLVRYIKIVCISKGEAKFLAKIFPKESISYVPFGVDQSFWTPSKTKDHSGAGYVLAIGNDLSRDWVSLVNSWKITFPTLKIVTRLPVPMHGRNIEVINGDWHSQLLSDAEILELYRDALFVIVPLRDTIQPAGQSVCLQAMACGKPVILSKVSGLWDSELIKDGENVLLVTPADADALGAAASRLISDAELREKIGRRGREIIESNFNTMAMAESLGHVLKKVVEA